MCCGWVVLMSGDAGGGGRVSSSGERGLGCGVGGGGSPVAEGVGWVGGSESRAGSGNGWEKRVVRKIEACYSRREKLMVRSTAPRSRRYGIRLLDKKSPGPHIIGPEVAVHLYCSATHHVLSDVWVSPTPPMCELVSAFLPIPRGERIPEVIVTLGKLGIVFCVTGLSHNMDQD